MINNFKDPYCQKVLPLIYDDSLSYYETVCKLIAHVNKIGDVVNSLDNIQGIDMSKIYFFDKIEDITYFANTVKCGLLVINNGKINKIPNDVVFSDGINILFVCGILDGNFSIHGKIISDNKQIFTLTSNVKINKNKNPIGFPEYYGAITNNISIDNSMYINKCIENFTITKLSAGDYYISNTIKINTDHKSLIGEKINQEYSLTETNGSRIIQINNERTAINIGDGTANGITTINVENLSVLNFEPVYSSITSGITIDGARAVKLNNITVSNFKLGYNLGYVTLSYIENCRYLNNRSSVDNNTCSGINITLKKGTTLGISSIVSVYLIKNDIHYNNYNANNIGIYCNGTGGLADLFIDKNNFYGCATGISINSNDDNKLQQNIWIKNNTIDNCVDGVKLKGNLKINIISNWVSCTKELDNITKHGILLDSISGDGSVICCENNIKLADSNDLENNYGIRVLNCTGIICTNNNVFNFTNPVYWSATKDSKINAMCVNYKSNKDKYACILEQCTNVVCEVGVSGGNKYQGVQLLHSVYCMVLTNLLRTSNITGGKVVINATPVTAQDIYKQLESGNTICGSI